VVGVIREESNIVHTARFEFWSEMCAIIQSQQQIVSLRLATLGY
jgi:hypothetical protein